MPNTEKPTTIAQQEKSSAVKTIKKQETPKSSVVKAKSDDKIETEKTEKKKPVKTQPKIKKDFAVVNGKDIPISTKDSIAICKFIKNKKIDRAINDLEQVVAKRKAVPMKGEIPHRKGKIMSGRFPKKSSEHFIKLLKSLATNSIANNMNEPIITEAVANLAPRPYGRFGRTQKKRTHIKIKCTEKKLKND